MKINGLNWRNIHLRMTELMRNGSLKKNVNVGVKALHYDSAKINPNTGQAKVPAISVWQAKRLTCVQLFGRTCGWHSEAKPISRKIAATISVKRALDLESFGSYCFNSQMVISSKCSSLMKLALGNNFSLLEDYRKANNLAILKELGKHLIPTTYR